MDEKQEKLNPLVSYIQECFERARTAKLPIEERMIRNLYVFKCQYEPQKLAEIRDIGGSEIYLPLANIKARALKAWLTDIFFSNNEPPFTVEPTPVPELPSDLEIQVKESLRNEIADIVQKARMLYEVSGGQFDIPALMLKLKESVEDIKAQLRDRMYEYAKQLAEREKKRIDDQFTEGGFYDALDECLFDLAIFPCAILKSCVPRKVKAFNRQRQITNRVIPTFNRVSPFDIYPSPSVPDFSDWVIEVLHLTPQDLADLKGIEGYDEAAIDFILGLYGDTGYSINENLRSERFSLEGKRIDYYNLIDILEFWGSVPGSLLIEADISLPDIEIEEDAYYDVAIWVCDNHVLKATINPDPFGMKPYHKASFIEIPDSFWGLSLIDVLYDLQQGVNALARAIINNAALSSGPMIERNIDRVPPHEEKVIIPWKIFDSTSMGITNEPAYRFYQPNLTAAALIQVIAYYMKLADELSGIPAYSHGDVTVGGAGRCLAKYSRIVTIDGYKEIKDLKVGDLVATIDGSFTKVVGFYPQPEQETLYRVYFSDGSFVDCTDDHLWVVLDSKGKKHIKTVKELIDEGIVDERNCRSSKTGKKTICKWKLPKIKPIQFPYKGVKIDPYTLGYFIGNGSTHKGYVRLSIPEEYLSDVLKRIPYKTNKPVKGKNSGKSVSVGVPSIGVFIREYGLDKVKADSKFIPKDYLYNSIEIRLELLRGLIDSDGYIDKKGSVVFVTTSRQLIEDLRFLVKSLGGRVYSILECSDEEREFPSGKVYKTKKSYSMYFRVPVDVISYIQKKQDRYRRGNIPFVYIKSIEPLNIKEDVYCIKVEHKSSIFLCEDCIPTHNTASGLSMLMSNANRGIKEVVKNIDKGLIEPTVRRLYYFNVINYYGLEDEIPDLNIKAKGSIVLMEKLTQAQKLLELLNLTNNPVDMQIVGVEGRRYLLEHVFKNFGVHIPMSNEIDQMVASLTQQLTQLQQKKKSKEEVEPVIETAQENRKEMLALGGNQ